MTDDAKGAERRSLQPLLQGLPVPPQGMNWYSLQALPENCSSAINKGLDQELLFNYRQKHTHHKMESMFIIIACLILATAWVNLHNLGLPLVPVFNQKFKEGASYSGERAMFSGLNMEVVSARLTVYKVIDVPMMGKFITCEYEIIQKVPFEADRYCRMDKISNPFTTIPSNHHIFAAYRWKEEK
jgi:hypothetical protein